MHARDCVPTATDGISPRPPFAWPSPKNVWFFTAVNNIYLKPDRLRRWVPSHRDRVFFVPAAMMPPPLSKALYADGRIVKTNGGYRLAST
jgi:hypothetical protein